MKNAIFAFAAAFSVLVPCFGQERESNFDKILKKMIENSANQAQDRAEVQSFDWSKTGTYAITTGNGRKFQVANLDWNARTTKRGIPLTPDALFGFARKMYFNPQSTGGIPHQYRVSIDYKSSGSRDLLGVTWDVLTENGSGWVLCDVNALGGQSLGGENWVLNLMGNTISSIEKIGNN